MTVLESLLKEWEWKANEIVNLEDELENVESNMFGMEITYNGHYAVIEHADWTRLEIGIYVEEEDGTSYRELLTLEEFREVMGY